MPSNSKDSLDRKMVQVSVPAYNEIVRRKAAKEGKLAKEGHPREVTRGEIIDEALGL